MTPDSLPNAIWDFRNAPPDGGRDYGNANVLAFTPYLHTLVSGVSIASHRSMNIMFFCVPT